MPRLAVLLLALCPLGAAAAPDYEQRLIDWALETTGRAAEPAPEGKRIEEIVIASEEIFSASDPYPSELNLLHRLTRDQVVRREVLIEVGSRYLPEKAAETERNLRRQFIFAVARVVPVVGRDGGVGLLVVTKDRWSLRLNSDFNFVGPVLQYLRLRPTEQNFLGFNQQVVIDLVLKLDTLQVGEVFEDPRLFGTHFYFGQTAALVLSRETLAAEGSAGKVIFGRKLISLEDPWGLTGEAQWDVRTWRVFRGSSLWMLDGPGGEVPNVFEGKSLKGRLLYTRSFGRELKANLSAGLGGHSRLYLAPAASPLSAEQRSFLEQGYLPPSESALYLTAQLRAFQARFRVLHDIDSFTLSEDFQLGWQVQLWARWAHPAFFSPSRFFEAGSWARYRLLASDDLATLTLAASARAQGGWVNQRLGAELSNVSPSLGFGRLVTRAVVDLRGNDLDPRPVLLGGGNGLRGSAAEALAGRNLALLNVELRTRAIELRTVYLGFAFFWDAGSAFEAAPAFTHTLGAGLRILLPQFNQETIRIDFGLVLGGRSDVSVDRFSGSFGQVTDYRPAILDEPGS